MVSIDKIGKVLKMGVDVYFYHLNNFKNVPVAYDKTELWKKELSEGVCSLTASYLAEECVLESNVPGLSIINCRHTGEEI